MTDRPILFSGPMVRALLAGTKTQTRRLLVDRLKRWPSATQQLDQLFRDDPRSRIRVSAGGSVLVDTHGGVASGIAESPYGVPGDRLWVRETFASFVGSGERSKPTEASYVVLRDGTQVYRDDGTIVPPLPHYSDGAFESISWRPSIHLPRWASRITLEVTEVRVERLLDISEADARAEGVTGNPCADESYEYDPTCAFAALWDSINGERAPWASNPWVWVVSFRVVTP